MLNDDTGKGQTQQEGAALAALAAAGKPLAWFYPDEVPPKVIQAGAEHYAEHKEMRGRAVPLGVLPQAEDVAIWPSGSQKSEFYVGCDGILEASTEGPRDTALKEAMHLAAQYAQDGEVSVTEIMRRTIRIGV